MSEVNSQVGSKARPRSSIEFRLLFAATFVVFLVDTCIARLLPWRSTERGVVASTHKSIFDESRARTDQVVPFFFMG